MLAKGIAAERGKLTEDVIGKTHHAVDMVLPGVLYGGKTPIRTLWHALYFPEQRKVRVSFYLGDEPDADDTKEPRIRRSDTWSSCLRARRRKKERALTGMSVDARRALDLVDGA